MTWQRLHNDCPLSDPLIYVSCNFPRPLNQLLRIGARFNQPGYFRAAFAAVKAAMSRHGTLPERGTPRCWPPTLSAQQAPTIAEHNSSEAVTAVLRALKASTAHSSLSTALDLAQHLTQLFPAMMFNVATLEPMAQAWRLHSQEMAAAHLAHDEGAPQQMHSHGGVLVAQGRAGLARCSKVVAQADADMRYTSIVRLGMYQPNTSL